nr:uncharacterized protein LOC123769625 [Procambarus clarkii]
MSSSTSDIQDKVRANLFVSIRRKKEKLETCSLERKTEKKATDDNYFTLRRQRWGSDPRLQTCRGKLQNRRSKLNQEINKELMLRAGAQNLFNEESSNTDLEIVNCKTQASESQPEKLIKREIKESEDHLDTPDNYKYKVKDNGSNCDLQSSDQIEIIGEHQSNSNIIEVAENLQSEQIDNQQSKDTVNNNSESAFEEKLLSIETLEAPQEEPPPPPLSDNFTDPEDVLIITQKSYNLDVLDNLNDPNFNPFPTKTYIRSPPLPSPEPGYLALTEDKSEENQRLVYQRKPPGKKGFTVVKNKAKIKVPSIDDTDLPKEIVNVPEHSDKDDPNFDPFQSRSSLNKNTSTLRESNSSNIVPKNIDIAKVNSVNIETKSDTECDKDSATDFRTQVEYSKDSVRSFSRKHKRRIFISNKIEKEDKPEVIESNISEKETRVSIGDTQEIEINLPKVASIGTIGQLNSLEFAQLLGNEASRLAKVFINCSTDSGLPDSDESSYIKPHNNHSEAGPENATGLTSSDLRCASQLNTEDAEEMRDQITDEEFLASQAFFKKATDMENQLRKSLATPLMGSHSKLSGDDVRPTRDRRDHPAVTPVSPQHKSRAHLPLLHCDFILEHYSEEPDKYDEAISEFMDLRGAMRTPERDESGVALLFEYFNQLYFIDRRFFPPDRSLGIYFEWYDSLTGTPSCQRTVAFEKACVLFNLGALYTQLGARHDRTSAAGLDAAVNNFLRAAGMFRYLHDTFTNAPSKDLSPEVLDMLIHLMLVSVPDLYKVFLHYAFRYSQVLKTISGASVKDYVPASWISMVHIKAEYYRGRAHYRMAEALLTLPIDERDQEQLSIRVQNALQFVHLPPVSNTTLEISVPTNHQERTLLGLAHCRESVLVHEEAMRQQRMCRDLKKKSALTEVLHFGHEAAVHLLDLYEEEEDLLNVWDPPPIASATKIQLSLTAPDFSQHRVEDVFKLLGPVAVFSAKHQWSAPRPISITRTVTQGFGFSVRGDAPVVIAGVDRGSLAERAGVNEGDLVVCIGNRDVKWMPHDEVVGLIRDAGNMLSLTLVTPCDKTYYKLPKSKSLKDISPHSTTSSSSGISSSSSNGSSSHFGSVNSSSLSTKDKDKRNSWNPFKRSTSRDKLKSDSLIDCNVILR